MFPVLKTNSSSGLSLNHVQHLSLGLRPRRSLLSNPLHVAEKKDRAKAASSQHEKARFARAFFMALKDQSNVRRNILFEPFMPTPIA